jgi:cysteinyl-tRNA synthetase
MPVNLRFYDTYKKDIVSLDHSSKNDDVINIYTCGPTVYYYQHIGNLFASFFGSNLKSILEFLGWRVNWVSNITDVGHLVGDGDEEKNVTSGEDKMEKAAKRDSLTVEGVTNFYFSKFKEDLASLNIDFPEGLYNPKASDYLGEQAQLALDMLDLGYAYINEYGIYFDSTKMVSLNLPKHSVFRLKNSGFDKTKTGREIINQEKDSEDFVLWRFVSDNNLQKWKLEDLLTKPAQHSLLSKVKDSVDSQKQRYLGQWGVPGWHSECVSMITKIFGQSNSAEFDYTKLNSPIIDIHTGGEDHIAVHHKNEILTSKSCGFDLSKYWIHNKHILIDGAKISKSTGTSYLILPAEKNPEWPNLLDHGYIPLVFRLLMLEHDYRYNINFTWEKMDQSKNRLLNLRKQVACIFSFANLKGISPSINSIDKPKKIYQEILSDNLNTPLFLEKFQNLVQENLDFINKNSDLNPQNLELIKFLEEKILRLDLIPKVPQDIQELVSLRAEAKLQKNYILADEFRKKVLDMGWSIDDYVWGCAVWCQK